MTIKYVNSKGDEITLSSHPFWLLRATDLFDFSLKYDERFNKIYDIRRQIEPKQFDLCIKGKTTEEFKNNVKQFYNVTAFDSEVKVPGTLIVDDYEIKCFVVASSKKQEYINRKSTIVNIGIVPERNNGWIKKERYFFKADDITDGLDYPYDYPNDYTSSKPKNVYNSNYVDADFVMRIYGACHYPTVTLSGNDYTVYVDVPEDGYLEIDSVEKTIRLYDKYGLYTNVFSARDRDNYIFEPIKVGSSLLERNSSFDVEIVLVEKRSEPEWI